MSEKLVYFIMFLLIFGPMIFGLTSHWYRTHNAPCGRCKGTGYLPKYKHIHGGDCFLCNAPASFLVGPQERHAKHIKALQREVEAQNAEEKYRAKKRELYRSLSESELMEIWETRLDSSLTSCEVAILRQIVRDVKGIRPAPAVTLAVCGDCGMVGSNCNCGQN